MQQYISPSLVLRSPQPKNQYNMFGKNLFSVDVAGNTSRDEMCILILVLHNNRIRHCHSSVKMTLIMYCKPKW